MVLLWTVERADVSLGTSFVSPSVITSSSCLFITCPHFIHTDSTSYLACVYDFLHLTDKHRSHQFSLFSVPVGSQSVFQFICGSCKILTRNTHYQPFKTSFTTPKDIVVKKKKLCKRYNKEIGFLPYILF